MDFSAISLKIGTLGDKAALGVLDQIDQKAQQTAQQVNDIFDNTLYKGSLRDAERDYDRLVNAWKNGSEEAAVAVQNVSTQISGLGSRLQQVAVSGSLVGADLAEGGSYGVMRFARTIANLGFVVDPVVGGLTLLAATVGEALFTSLEKSKKEADAFRKSLTDLINAGQTAKIGEKIYDVEVGTAAENYEDGLVALKAKLATVEARFHEMHLGGQSAQIQELQGKIATAQSKLDELLRAQQLAMRSSAYYDRQNEASTRADAKADRDALRVPRADTSTTDELAPIRASERAWARRLEAERKAANAAQKKMHEEDVRVYDELNKGLAKHIRAVTGKQNPLLAEEEALAKGIQHLGQRLTDEVNQSIGSTLARSIQTAFSAAFSGKGVTGGIEAFGKMIMQGLGNLFERLGEIWMEYGLAMLKLVPALSNPITSGPAAIAIGAMLIALGGALSAATGGGGRSGGGYSSGYSGATTVITTGIVNPGAPAGTATPAGSVHARPSVTNHNYIIGPADPVAQRMWDELQRRSLQRGSIRGA